MAKLFYFCHLKKLVRPETFGPYYVYSQLIITYLGLYSSLYGCKSGLLPWRERGDWGCSKAELEGNVYFMKGSNWGNREKCQLRCFRIFSQLSFLGWLNFEGWKWLWLRSLRDMSVQARRVGWRTAPVHSQFGIRRRRTVSNTLRPLYLPVRPGTHCTWGRMVLGSGLDETKNRAPYPDSIPEPSIP